MSADSYSGGAGRDAELAGNDESVKYREDLIREIASAVRGAGRSAARTAALAGAVVQIIGAAVMFWALAQQLTGDRDLQESEFVTVIVVGAVLLAVGPRAGKAATPEPPDEHALALEGEKRARADARERAELARRKAADGT